MQYHTDARGQDVISPAIRCVVLDAGHGGHDYGCISADKKTSEKNIALSVVLKLGKMISDSYPDIKVLYTRDSDVFIALAERADIANRNKADLFISVHVNSAGNNSSASGTETFTMGNHVSNSNFEISKRENSVILLEEDYKTTYAGFDPDSPESYIIFSLLQNAYSEQSLELAQLIQKEYSKGPITRDRGVKQAGFLVLWRTTMPSILTEIGFISNKSDLSEMKSSAGQEAIAKRIFTAFTKYKAEYERGVSWEGEDYGAISINEKQASAPDEPSEKNSSENIESGSFYAIQILSVSKKLGAGSSELKGRKDAKYVKGADGLYKYYLGNYASRSDASKDLAKVGKTFKGAFIIEIRGGKIVKH